METTYYTNGNVTVTNARVVLPSQTYAMAGITSVKFEEEKPKRLRPVLLIIVCMVLAVKTNQNVWNVLVAMLPGVIWMAMQKTKFCIRLSSSSGESRALESKNAKFVKSVVGAINTAIIERG